MLPYGVTIKEVSGSDRKGKSSVPYKGGFLCVVDHCGKHSRKNPETSFFRFPRDKPRLKQWLQACHREDLLSKNLYTLYNGYKICSDHFSSDMMKQNCGDRRRLEKHAVPVLHLEEVEYAENVSGFVGYGDTAAQSAPSAFFPSGDLVRVGPIEIENAKVTVSSKNNLAQESVIILQGSEVYGGIGSHINSLSSSSIMKDNSSLPDVVFPSSRNFFVMTESETLHGEKQMEDSFKFNKDLLEEVRNLLCRVCGRKKEMLTPIHSDNEEVDGDALTLTKKIEMYLPLQIRADGVLPKNICNGCRCMVEAWHELHVASVAADSLLGKMFNPRQCENNSEDHSEEGRLEEEKPNNSGLQDNDVSYETQKTENYAEEGELSASGEDIEKKTKSSCVQVNHQYVQQSEQIDNVVIEAAVKESSFENSHNNNNNNNRITFLSTSNSHDVPFVPISQNVTCEQYNASSLKSVLSLPDNELNIMRNQLPQIGNTTKFVETNMVNHQRNFCQPSPFIPSQYFLLEDQPSNKCFLSKGIPVVSGYTRNSGGTSESNLQSTGSNLRNISGILWPVKSRHRTILPKAMPQTDPSEAIETPEYPTIAVATVAEEDASESVDVTTKLRDDEKEEIVECESLGVAAEETVGGEIETETSTTELLLSLPEIKQGSQNSSSLMKKTNSSKSSPLLPCKSSPEQETSFLDLSPSTNLRLLTCRYCSEIFSTRDKVNEHKKTCALEPVICDTCGKAVAHRYLLRQHVQIHIYRPTERKMYICDKCGKKMYSRSALQYHVQHSHSEEREIKHYCEPCCKLFVSDRAYRVHLSGHKKNFFREFHFQITAQQKEDELIFVCPVCRENFNDKKSLIIHVNTKKGVMCGKCRTWELNEKMMFFHKCKINRCQFCGKHFNTRQSLYNHKHIHRREKPFHCSKCGEQFQTRTEVINHRRKHELSVHKCEVYGREFKSKENYSKHLMTHRSSAFQCLICDKMYLSKGSLARHSKKWHQGI